MASVVVGALKVLLQGDTAQFETTMKGATLSAQKLAERLRKDVEPSQQKVNAAMRQFLGTQEIGRAKAYADAVKEIGGANKLTERDQIKINKAVLEALQYYRALGQAAPPKLLELATATAQLKKNTEQLAAAAPKVGALGDSFSGLLSKAKGLAGLFGVSLGASAITGFISSVFSAADQIGDLATKMGVSTEAAQRFQYAARQAGADIEDVTKAVTHLNAGLGEGKDSGVAKALKQIGLEFETIRNMKPEDAFRATLEAVSEIADPMEQAAAASALFGDKLGAQLLPLIREGALKAADQIDVMSDATVKRLKDAEQAWKNFGDAIVIATGESLADTMSAMDLFLSDWGAAWRIAAAMAQGMNLSGAVMVEQARYNATHPKALPWVEGLPGQLEEVGAYGGMFGGITIPNTKPGDRHFTPIDPKEEAARKKAIADYAAMRERIDDYKDSILGLNKAQREQLKGLQELAHEGHIKEVAALLSVEDQLDKVTRKSIIHGRVMTAVGDSYYVTTERIAGLSAILSVTPLNKLMPGAISVDRLAAQAKIPPEAFGKTLEGLIGQSSSILLNSFQGGGNPLKALGALFGGGVAGSARLMGVRSKTANAKGEFNFTGGAGKAWQKLAGNKYGGMIADAVPAIASAGLSSLLSTGGGEGMLSNIGSFAATGMMFGPWGAAVGAGIGAIVGIIKKGANNTKKARNEFAKELGFGTTDALYDKLKTMGDTGARLANIGLNVIGKQDVAANKRWMDDVTAFFDRLEKVPGKVNELTQALEAFGGVIPDAVGPLLQDILRNPNLSGDMRRQLEGLQAPKWQQAQQMAERFGINPAALGASFNQARLADMAFQLKRAIDLFGKFDGSDQKAVLRDMADEFSALAMDAKRTGAALPKAVEAFVRQVDEMGLLVDENGNRIDSSLLTFTDIEDEYQKQVVSLLEEIRDLLRGPVDPNKPNDPGFVPKVPGTPPTPPRPPGGIVDPTLPDFGNFGPGTPVTNGGTASIMTGGDGSTTIVLEVDGRKFAQAVVPHIPTEVTRLGLARG